MSLECLRLPAALLVVAAAPDVRGQPVASPPRADPRRLEARILELGRFGANPEGGATSWGGAKAASRGSPPSCSARTSTPCPEAGTTTAT